MFMDPCDNIHESQKSDAWWYNPDKKCVPRTLPRRDQQEMDSWEDEGVGDRVRGAMGCDSYSYTQL